MADRSWTGPQHDAIHARGGQVLVSAAAGSGKTAVLVERAVQLICDEHAPVDADRLLIVTFSRAAAAEMKQRMAARLAEMIHAAPENLYLQRQQALLSGAQISTVDSFCMELVRQNFESLEISPDFSVLDPGELTIMQNDCAAACIDWFFDNDSSGVFPELVELLSAGRDDRQLAETILRIYDFSLSHPFFEEWLDQKLAMYDLDTPVAETVWGNAILDYARSSVSHCVRITENALDIIAMDSRMEKAYDAAFRSDLAQLRRCEQALAIADWDGTVTALAAFEFARLGALRGDDPLKDRVKAARDQVKSAVKGLADKYLNATGAQFAGDIADLHPKIELLFRMVRDFSDRLWQAKLEKKRLYFSDIAHLALRLLVEKTPDGGWRATPRAETIAAQYDYVLVDEYQDTNEVQDMLFSCVSRGQTNLFMVGDVKQSIYGFRQAMPEIFMSKKDAFHPFATDMYPAKIILDTNFRSRRQVTDGVNYLFSLLMSRALGDVEYNAEERLQCGAAFGEYRLAAPELLLVSTHGIEPPPDPTEAEAGAIARKIREMMDSGYEIEDRGELRPVQLRDFCILMRSPRGRAEVYVKELGRCGVAAGADSTGGFLSAREISAVVSLLKALDNPLLDIELVAAMLSPLFEFTADDIARIRLAARGKAFYSALGAAADAGDEKSAAFLRIFAHLRARAAVLSADRLIMEIYERTDAVAVFQAMSLGESRRANLLLLMEYAADYHTLGYKQLGGFVGFLGRLVERGGDLAPAGNLGEGANVVRVMSIHRSKGLEFPVVFLADTARQFNKVDLRQNTLLHSEYGFACVRRDHAAFKQYPTVPMQAIRLQAQRSILSEEMRILYVALTRAREKLIITGVCKTDPAKRLSGLCGELSDGRLPSYVLGECNCYLDWVLMALLHHPSCAALRNAAGNSELELRDDGNPWISQILDLVGETTDSVFAVPDQQHTSAAIPDAELLAQIHARAAWRYPHQAETTVPTKLAVSAVAKGGQDISYRFTARPKFLTNQRLTPTERGNAMHKFMQFASYKSAHDNLEAEITRMQSERFLSPAECAGLQRRRLWSFFRSGLARRIFASAKVWRELKFMAECGQAMLGEVAGDIGDSKIVLQGVADCVFEEDGAAVIVDYKTDRVQTPEELRYHYEAQLRLYKAILADSLGMPVNQCILYSFYLSQEIPL